MTYNFSKQQAYSVSDRRFVDAVKPFASSQWPFLPPRFFCTLPTSQKRAGRPAVTDPYAEVQPATETLDLNMYQRIRDEGLNHST